MTSLLGALTQAGGAGSGIGGGSGVGGEDDDDDDDESYNEADEDEGLLNDDEYSGDESDASADPVTSWK